jgi:CheY-like chemotaxis protein
MMDGQIGVDSDLGLGSTFYFSAIFPLADAEMLRQEAQTARLRRAKVAELPKLTHGRRALVVEDNPFNQEVIKELLERVGVSVTLADSGSAAIAILTADPQIDIVFMDVQMPDMDGHETTRLIRSTPALRNLVIIAMTASVTVEERERCLASGMQDFQPKPIKPDELYLLLGKWIANASGQKPLSIPEPPALIEFSDSKILDLSLLSAQFPENPSKVTQLQDLFFKTGADIVTAMAKARRASNQIELARLAHKFKSAASTVGAKAIAERCEAIEREVLAGRSASAYTLAEAVADSFEKLRELSGRSAAGAMAMESPT